MFWITPQPDLHLVPRWGSMQPSNLKVGLELDCSHWCSPDNHNFLGALKDGTILQVRIKGDEVSAMTTSNVSLELAIVGVSIFSSCFVCSRDNHWFVGSRQSDSILLSVSKSKIESEQPTQSSDAMTGSTTVTPASTPSKIVKVSRKKP